MHWTAGFHLCCIPKATGPPPVMSIVRRDEHRQHSSGLFPKAPGWSLVCGCDFSAGSCRPPLALCPTLRLRLDVRGLSYRRIDCVPRRLMWSLLRAFGDVHGSRLCESDRGTCCASFRLWSYSLPRLFRVGHQFAMRAWFNERAAGKGGIPSLLTVEHARPALPEHERSATRANCVMDQIVTHD